MEKQTIYNGYLDIVEIKNEFPSIVDGNQHAGLSLDVNHVKFVQYSDCQQLIIWLPDAGSKYDRLSLVAAEDQAVIWENQVANILNGSIQMIFDTIVLKPGNYIMKIEKSDGIKHELLMYKAAIYERPAAKDNESDVVKENKEPIEYKDGFGKILPNQDLEFRNNTLKKMFEKLMRSVHYQNMGRGGYAIYTEGVKSIKFEMEYGGGKCIFILYIPSKEQWEKQTDFKLSEREDIIQFVADKVLHDQTTSSGAYYTISDTDITYFSSK